MVTSRDVARLARVSQATVSRTMSPTAGAKIAPETRARVEAAMEQLGYVPHAGAQAMKTRRTNTVGVVVADITNPFYPEVLDELTQVLDAAGYKMVIWNAGGSSHEDALSHDAVSAIRERAVDGVIFTTATGDSVELRTALEQGSPIILINRVVDGLDCDQVASDNRAGGADVAEYLVRHHRTRAAFIGGPDAASTARDRASGFLERMRELGHPVADSLRRNGEFSHDLSMRITADLLAGNAKPDAIFCANDYMAFGALDALRAAGLAAPDDCWVIGYDDVKMASWASFDVTTVRQPSRDMARVGATMLMDRMSSPSLPTHSVSFPCELVIRGSTGGLD